jgi:hypothetical protein
MPGSSPDSTPSVVSEESPLEGVPTLVVPDGPVDDDDPEEPVESFKGNASVKHAESPRP